MLLIKKTGCSSPGKVAHPETQAGKVAQPPHHESEPATPLVTSPVAQPSVIATPPAVSMTPPPATPKPVTRQRKPLLLKQLEAYNKPGLTEDTPAMSPHRVTRQSNKSN